uniref:Uncharacterized protein n=1 Tax=Aegilops tauschii subsp. strangulata TaxID=200361 RepID=A0A453LFK0_AEGTS
RRLLSAMVGGEANSLFVPGVFWRTIHKLGNCVLAVASEIGAGLDFLC